MADLRDSAAGKGGIILAGVRMIAPGAGRMLAVLDGTGRDLSGADPIHLLRDNREGGVHDVAEL